MTVCGANCEKWKQSVKFELDSGYLEHEFKNRIGDLLSLLPFS